jgi:chromosome segregation ATPase
MTNRIEWDEPGPVLRAGLVVERCVDNVWDRQNATVEDLRKACEVMGLHVVDRSAVEANKHNPVRAALDPMNNAASVGLVALASDVRRALEVSLSNAAKLESEVANLRANLEVTHAVVYATSDRNEWKRRAEVVAGELDAVTTEIASLRTQLDALRSNHNATVAAANRSIEDLRAELAAAKACLRREEVPEAPLSGAI